jgi:hypothetical protein
MVIVKTNGKKVKMNKEQFKKFLLECREQKKIKKEVEKVIN